mgnify:FL=1
MNDKTTGELTSELMSRASIDLYLSSNASSFSEQNVSELLTQLYEKKSITKAELARRAGISEVYLHQVFSGRRNPSRDRLLCICIGLGATLDEIQSLLKRVSYAQIYPKIKRDAIISFGVVHHMDLNSINDKLFAENEKTLF